MIQMEDLPAAGITGSDMRIHGVPTYGKADRDPL